MKKTYLIGIVAVLVAAAFAVLAADKKPADQTLIRLKVGGKTVAEMRVLDNTALSIKGDQVNHIVQNQHYPRQRSDYPVRRSVRKQYQCESRRGRDCKSERMTPNKRVRST